ncbi:MAG TPA: serine/threonine protein kinase [Candidatus Aminicenantes bacterium]|nr:serine/threonine protein kinase [Candidatus Aminicenantes bacterium]
MIKAGSTLGQFQILRKVGRGGMGTIFAAMDTVLHRKVALKVIHEHLVGNLKSVEAFRKEAITQAQLTHPNIVSVYASHQLDNHHAMVMEYVEGESLRDILRQRGHLSVLEAVGNMRQLLRGLRYAHSFNIVHLDIKPGNLIRTPTGQLKISDFGIAAIAGIHPSEEDGFIMATPWYAAPEQLCGRPADQRCDLFSAGVTLYEMLTGEIPYDAGAWDPEHPKKWVDRIKEWMPPSSKREGIDKALDEFVSRSVQKKPERRFQTAGEMLIALDGIRLATLPA